MAHNSCIGALRPPGELVGKKGYKEHVGCLNVSPAIAKQVIAAA